MKSCIHPLDEIGVRRSRLVPAPLGGHQLLASNLCKLKLVQAQVATLFPSPCWTSSLVISTQQNASGRRRISLDAKRHLYFGVVPRWPFLPAGTKRNETKLPKRHPKITLSRHTHEPKLFSWASRAAALLLLSLHLLPQPSTATLMRVHSHPPASFFSSFQSDDKLFPIEAVPFLRR